MIIKYSDKIPEKLEKILNRGNVQQDTYLNTVLDILDNVQRRGDEALVEYTNKFDRRNIEKIERIPSEFIKDYVKTVDADLLKCLEQAAQRIKKFHEMQVEKSWYYNDNGIMLGQRITPLESVGVYVPGGKASYPSSVLMNVIPAKVAGVKRIVMVTPAPDDVISPAVLAAAVVAGVEEIYTIGGAQAIAALAYGTATIQKVDKIVGPGNVYVALAKKMVFGTVDIDMIAGPSEILIIADESANPEWVAADMLSQAEHDELASAVVITDSETLARKINEEITNQIKLLPRREIAEKSMNNYSAIIIVSNMDEACKLAGKIAPEHLELAVMYPFEMMAKIKHAGAFFLGHYTPEAAGDYFAGTNHVLPTGGSARFSSPLGVYDFIKRSGVVYYSKEMIEKHAEIIEKLALAEGLAGHAKSAMLRKKIK